jgi:hypothetical protein
VTAAIQPAEVYARLCCMEDSSCDEAKRSVMVDMRQLDDGFSFTKTTSTGSTFNAPIRVSGVMQESMTLVRPKAAGESWHEKKHCFSWLGKSHHPLQQRFRYDLIQQRFRKDLHTRARAKRSADPFRTETNVRLCSRGRVRRSHGRWIDSFRLSSSERASLSTTSSRSSMTKLT